MLPGAQTLGGFSHSDAPYRPGYEHAAHGAQSEPSVWWVQPVSGAGRDGLPGRSCMHRLSVSQPLTAPVGLLREQGSNGHSGSLFMPVSDQTSLHASPVRLHGVLSRLPLLRPHACTRLHDVPDSRAPCLPLLPVQLYQMPGQGGGLHSPGTTHTQEQVKACLTHLLGKHGRKLSVAQLPDGACVPPGPLRCPRSVPRLGCGRVRCAATRSLARSL
jgi:hypothetical protein